ncbi:PTS sugar transporter subunit IIA [Enterococcus sp. ALS3]|uniref:PTS sugar transporter subunit IIA n=1 Tax=Enterococcus alishanensis TaxID=1303817 RepID=A0ABS6TC25_9ENTE|nr:PTS sugar transporter subunit IIA [Enterococcus alishanensis]MBV7390460.1 PTS sugar transporter subunit IIA [Enterococcus alishanensis]
MRNILIATHSTFASGIQGSLNLLIGERSEITVIDAYVDDTDYTEKIDDFFEKYNDQDEYIVFTDLYGGSVNQKMVNYKNKYDFQLITGFNLPILLEIILAGETLNSSMVEELVEKCRQELSLVHIDMTEDDEDDFI